ncbi:MAG: hypothetical protein ABIP16_07635 [Thermomonas sp.]
MSPRALPPSLRLLTIAILAVLPVLSAYAKKPQSAPPQRDRGQQGNTQNRDQSRDNSLSEAVRRVERDTRGEVLSAERVQYDGRDMHRVKVVDDEGRVRIFMQDPNRRDDGNAGFNPAGPARNNDRNDGDKARDSRHRQRPTRDHDD